MITSRSYASNGFAAFGLVMVVATITLIGLVAFRFLNAQDNTQVATAQASTTKVATLNSSKDIDTVTESLDTADIDSLDADLSAEFDF